MTTTTAEIVDNRSNDYSSLDAFLAAAYRTPKQYCLVSNGSDDVVLVFIPLPVLNLMWPRGIYLDPEIEPMIIVGEDSPDEFDESFVVAEKVHEIIPLVVNRHAPVTVVQHGRLVGAFVSYDWADRFLRARSVWPVVEQGEDETAAKSYYLNRIKSLTYRKG